MLLMSRIFYCVIFVIVGWIFPAIPQASADVWDLSRESPKLEKLQKNISKDQCKIGVSIYELYEFDYSSHTFDADFLIWSLCWSLPTKHHLEELDYMNSITIRAGPIKTVYKKNYIHSYRRVIGNFHHLWNLKAFPFDDQTLILLIGSASWDSHSIDYHLDFKSSELHDFHYSNIWDVKSFTGEISKGHPQTTYGNPSIDQSELFSRIAVSVDITRESTAVFWRLTVGVFSAVLVMMMTFFVHPKIDALHNAQLALIIGSLFSVLMSYRNVGDYLGYAERLSLIDGVHIGGIFFILIAGSAAVIKRYLVCHMNVTIKHPDLRGLSLYVLSYILFNVGVFVWATQTT